MKNSINLTEKALNVAMTIDTTDVTKYVDILGAEHIQPQLFDIVAVTDAKVTRTGDIRRSAVILSNYMGDSTLDALTSVAMAIIKASEGTNAINDAFEAVHGATGVTSGLKDTAKVLASFFKTYALYRCHFNGVKRVLIPFFESDVILRNIDLIPQPAKRDKEGNIVGVPTIIDRLSAKEFSLKSSKGRKLFREALKAHCAAVYDKATSLSRCYDYIKRGTFDKMLSASAHDTYLVAQYVAADTEAAIEAVAM